ncbi:MAG: ComF family protein [bacterium]|nr:ComF family protein [bacterium]
MNFIFASDCRVCKNLLSSLEEKYICKDCFSKIEFITSPYCDKCGKILVESFKEIEKPICKDCYSLKRYFYEARAVSIYEGALREGIHILKFEKKVGIHKPLGDLLVRYLKEQQEDLISRIDFLIPVPLHRKRFNSRGFNQAQLLCDYIEKHLNLPVILDLQRIRWTTPQMNLGRSERLQNIKGAFEVKNKDTISGKQILLVDDIFTTGATVNECSRVLIKAGAKQVSVLTLARGR